ncbi:MAG: TlpA family protein disulfide reductase [Treponema sp.]|nr:TlpA family protein disulfide reductase [Treponema sp.]
MKHFNLFGQMSSKRIMVLAFLSCAAFSAFCGGKKDKPSVKTEPKVEETVAPVIQEEEKVPEVQVPDLTLNFKGLDLSTGMDVDQKEFAPAKLTLVNIWGTFCQPCLVELPDLEKLSKKVMWQRVQVVGILCDVFDTSFKGELDLAKKIIREKNVSYRNFIIAKNTPWLRNIQAVPTSYIVDSKGKVVAGPIIGSRSADEYKALIDEALEKLKK